MLVKYDASDCKLENIDAIDLLGLKYSVSYNKKQSN